MIIPIRTDYRMTCKPWMNYVIILANVGLFLACQFSIGSTPQGMDLIDQLLLHPDSPMLSQFFSSMFMHAGWSHLIGNMIFLWVFGNAVNDHFGQIGYLAFYLAGGILAGMGYILLGGTAPVLGASGAIAAVTGAYLVLLPRARVTLIMLVIYFIVPVEVSSLLFLAFQFVFNLWMSLSPAFTGQSAGGVAWGAHSSGYLFGIAVAAAMLGWRLLPRQPYDLLSMFTAFRRRAQYKHMVVGGYDPFNYNRPGTPAARHIASAVAQPVSEAQQREFELRRDISALAGRRDIAGAADKYLQLVQIAEDPTLPLQQQLDVANQLMASEQYPAAADAYERFLARYGVGYEHLSDIYLMLGLLYSRYLQQSDRAEKYLSLALEGLTDPRKQDLARGDLARVRQRR